MNINVGVTAGRLGLQDEGELGTPAQRNSLHEVFHCFPAML